ncbi:protein ITPRID2 isoform X2 [Melanotaenia boesemani]|uniref:protein ITPRID2 isoform X2 n=1 Tax=Melanotaenia boesemani TaxID=1250792 RepID=UPI001C03A66B|nr:protein ITPRID2 isoform X2 [Melanotaenia boesemani]
MTTSTQADMESGVLGMETNTTTDPLKTVSMAHKRRQAWAVSKDSIGQGSKSEHCDLEIASSLPECRTPLRASLDDQSASPNKGAPRNGCSFEDDLLLGAEANNLQFTNDKAETCFGLPADQKRSQFKEKGRSMNSTGSGKSSNVSSVSELLDLYEEDPEEILLNLGFGQEEPDLSAKIPSRFFNSTSSARGIDIKVYLGAQMQRMELENPNYALTSRFRQIEVFTTVANEFFQLYSQVSGQSVPQITSKEQSEGKEGGSGGEEKPAPLKRNNSALNAATVFKRRVSRRNLLGSTSESPDAPNQHTQLNGHAASPDNAKGSEQDSHGTDSDHQGDTVSQKHFRRKDNVALPTVTEEASGDKETERLVDGSSEQSRRGPECRLQLADHQSANQKPEAEGARLSLPFTPDKAVSTLTPPQLAQLRTENTNSFDMEEIQTNDDETLPGRTSRTTDLSRTVSQQSDSSGFAEEPSVDNSYLKESCDSCDSETTVTSHPSQDVATPHALDQPMFELPDGRQEEAEPAGATEADGRRNSREEDVHEGSSEQFPQYTAHHLPTNRLTGDQQEETQEGEQVEATDRTDPSTEPQTDGTQSMSASEPEQQHELEQTRNQSEQEPQHTEHLTETMADMDAPTEGDKDKAPTEHKIQDDFCSLYPSLPASPVFSALNRAKQNQLNRSGQQISPQINDAHQAPGGGRGRRGVFPMQRSSSLPSSLLSPRVVSSVRIQFGRGQTSCTTPSYTYKYAQDGVDGTKEEEALKEEEEEDGGQNNCLSTLIINPSYNEKLPASVPPKPIPRDLMRSSYSLQSSSPPPDLSLGDQVPSQSVPDLSFSQRQPNQFPQNIGTNQRQQGWNPAQMISNPSPLAVFSDPTPNHSPSFNSSPYPFSLNPHLQHHYASPPNLHHNNSLNHYSSLTSLHQPTTSPAPTHGSLTNLHQHHPSLAPHLHPVTPTMHHQSYNHPYSHHSPYHTPPQFASPYLGYHGYTMNPHLPFPHPVTQYPPPALEPSLHPGLTHSAPGLLPGLGSLHSPAQNFHPGLTPAAPGSGPSHTPSSTEMQLRRVLHEIRGTVQSLNQSQDDPPGVFGDHRAAAPTHQSLAEFQQKRQCLNVFRNQMTDLEMSIMRQQALVYKHLSPADRLEIEHLQSLRSAVREELQELEQQLEDRLIELTRHSRYKGLHRGSSVDSLSTSSALRAMEPMSDLLREQFFLQSELSYDGRAPSTDPSTRSSSPVRGEGRVDVKQRPEVYRASISITPAPPPRPNMNTEEEEGERRRDSEGVEGGKVGGEEEEEEAAGRFKVNNFQQLIQEIRESVAKEVRREIYNELLAAASPRSSPHPARQPHP